MPGVPAPTGPSGALMTGGPPAAFPWYPGAGRGIRDECFHASLPPAGAARAARDQAGKILAGWGLCGDTADTAVLLVSELVTNAGRFSQGEITMTLWRLPGLLVIEVSDQAHASLPVLREPGPDSETGRGLVLVEALSQEWAHYFPCPGWKTVYAVLAAADSCRDLAAGDSRHP
jgi:hypothetical protein